MNTHTQNNPQDNSQDRLSMLRNMVKYANPKIEQEKEKLKMLLRNSIFLASDTERKERWIEAVDLISDIEKLKSLQDSVIRENLRFVKGERDLLSEI